MSTKLMDKRGPPSLSVSAELTVSLPWWVSTQVLGGKSWVPVLAQPLSRCVAIGKLLGLSGLVSHL